MWQGFCCNPLRFTITTYSILRGLKLSTNNKTTSHSRTNHKLHLAVLAALPLMAMASFSASATPSAGSTCVQNSTGDLSCSNGGTDQSVIYNANVSAANSAFIGLSGTVDGKTITLNGVLTGTNVNIDGTTTGGAQLNKVGVYVYNGVNSVDNPNFDSSLLGGLVGDQSFNNSGTTINNRGSIYIDTTSGGVNAGFGTAGILVSGSNNTINNDGNIVLTAATPSATNLKQWGILIDNSAYETTGTNYNNVNNVVNNSGSINVSNILPSGTLASSAFVSAVTFKEAVIDEVLNNYGTLTASGGTSNKYVFTVYSDDNAGSVTVNNFGNISANGGSFTSGGSASYNAAVLLRAFSANLNNYADGIVNGNVMTRSTNASFGLYNAGLIDGSFVRYLGGSDADGTLSAAGDNWDGHFKDTYQPAITAEGIGRITGDFIVKQENTSNTSTFVSDLWIKPTLSGAVVHNNDSFTLLGGAFQIPVVSGTNLTYTVNGEAVTDLTTQTFNYNTALVNWDISLNGHGSVTATLNDASSIAGLSSAGVKTINNLMTFNSDLGASLQNEIEANKVRIAGEQLRPEANNASTQAAMSAANQVSSVIGMHQDQVRTASNGKSGVSTGEAAQGLGFWMQGFGFKGDQNQRGGIDGYSANTGGFVFGADSAIGNGDLRIGAALAYGSTTIDGQGTTTANRTNIDSYQGNVYGSWNAGTWYVDAALGYGQHQYKTKRYVALAGANMSGNHDADQYSAKIGVGYPLAMGNVTLTPLAALSYVHLDQAGYSETDATNSGAALTIGDTKTDSFRSGLGAKVSLPLSTGTVKTALEARAIWNHEFADTNQDIAARFAGGTSFTTNGVSQARDSANLGLGLSMNSANGQTLSVNYDADVRSSYFGQTASVKFRYDF